MPEAPKLLVRSTGGDDVRAKASVAAYEDNPLIEACGPILDRTQLARHLLHLPEIPPPGADRPAYLLEHDLLGIWRMHVPSPAGIEVAQTLDCMIRQGYVHRRPRSAATNRLLHGLPAIGGEHAAIQLAAAVGGVSGVGKSEALWRALSVRPQMTVHAQFPGMRGPLAQLLWLKVDVPESGSLSDLAETLFRALDEVLGTDYWQTVRKGRIRSGVYLAAEWLAKVRIHFLGILVIDEVQNLFKVATKARRTAALRGGHERPELGVADDQALKFILTLTNTSKIPVAVAGTPDGIGALTTRMSTSQRISTAGFREIPHAESPEDGYFKKMFLPRLASYQYLPERLEPSDELRHLVHRLSAGVARISVALWIHGQRCAIGRGARCLALGDLQAAANGPLKLIQPAVAALLSQDPRRMSLYQDLLPKGAL
jgi:hypothetical protein